MSHEYSPSVRVAFALAAFGALAALCLLLLPGCQGQPAETESVPAEESAPQDLYARAGASLEIVEREIFWGKDESLWTATVNSDGSIDKMKNLGEFEDRVRKIAVSGENLYVLTIEGIYRMDLDAEVSEAELIVDHGAQDDFWVTSAGLVHRSNDILSASDIDGANTAEIATGINDFVIANGQLYTLGTDGSFARSDLNGENRLELDGPAVRDEDALLIADSGNVYLASNNLLVCRGDDTASTVDLSYELGDPDRVVVTEGKILYESASGAGYRYVEGEDADEELDHSLFWGRKYSRVSNGNLFFNVGGDITVIDLNTFEWEDFDTEEAADESESSSSSSSLISDYKQGKAIEGDGTYNIAEEFAVTEMGNAATVETTHFSLGLYPAHWANGYWQIEPVSDTAIAFRYAPAVEAGYDGIVFTLCAYDWGDNAYAEAPAWALAGQSADKKYVVIFPTDVRYDPNSSEQAAQYQELRAYAETIDINANSHGNPLVVYS